MIMMMMMMTIIIIIIIIIIINVNYGKQIRKIAAVVLYLDEKHKRNRLSGIKQL
jgi:hypothetical protein